MTGRTVEQEEYIVGVSQPAPLGQRLAVARRVETLDRDRLGLGLEVKRLEIRRHVQSAFTTVLYGQRVTQARAEDVQIAENGVAVAKARLAAGDAIPAEVGQAEVELGRARLEFEQATSRRAQAIEALVTTIGDPTLHVESLEGSLEGSLALPTEGAAGLPGSPQRRYAGVGRVIAISLLMGARRTLKNLRGTS